MISFFIGKRGVGLFYRGVRGANNTDVYETLLPHAVRLAQTTEATIGTAESGYHFYQEFHADAHDPSQRDELCEWLHKKTRTYEQAIQEIGEANGS